MTQATLPGTVPETIEAIVDAREKYVEARDLRMEYGKKETELRIKLIEAMQKHERTVYSDGKYVVEVIQGKTRVKVKTAAGDEGDDDPPEEE